MANLRIADYDMTVGPSREDPSHTTNRARIRLEVEIDQSDPEWGEIASMLVTDPDSEELLDSVVEVIDDARYQDDEDDDENFDVDEDDDQPGDEDPMMLTDRTRLELQVDAIDLTVDGARVQNRLAGVVATLVVADNMTAARNFARFIERVLDIEDEVLRERIIDRVLDESSLVRGPVVAADGMLVAPAPAIRRGVMLGLDLQPVSGGLAVTVGGDSTELHTAAVGFAPEQVVTADYNPARPLLVESVRVEDVGANAFSELVEASTVSAQPLVIDHAVDGETFPPR